MKPSRAWNNRERGGVKPYLLAWAAGLLALGGGVAGFIKHQGEKQLAPFNQPEKPTQELRDLPPSQKHTSEKLQPYNPN